MSLDGAQTTAEDAAVAAVTAVLAAYSEATRTRDVPGMKALFHKDAVMSGWLGPDCLVGSPEAFFSVLEAQEVESSYAPTTEVVRVSETIAYGMTSEQKFFGMAFENHFHLLKQPDGAWLITSKLFRHF